MPLQLETHFDRFAKLALRLEALQSSQPAVMVNVLGLVYRAIAALVYSQRHDFSASHK